ncbi:methionine/alanine import family NSS transporter small subunit [Bacillus sp. FJAT-47783]|nr:methionine/alanine import family NSS transporter small subunit [Bacillus sp. FJAT-47783]
MSAGAITMMVVGMVIIWGGLAASVANAVKKARQAK